MTSRLPYLSASALVLVVAAGCTVTTTDANDAATTTDTNPSGDTNPTTDTNPAADTGPGTDTNPADDTGTDTTPPADTGTTADTSTWVPPPDPSAYYVRFVVATSDFTTGADFDLCYLPWDGVTSASGTDTYIGPIANSLSGSFTAPEVSNYYKLDLNASHKTIRVRLVAKGSSCAESAKFSISVGGTSHLVSITDDTAVFQPGYNTAIVFGNITTSSYNLLSLHDTDPTAAATSPTLQFFNGYNGSLAVTLTALDGTVYTLSTGASVAFKSYVSLPFTATAATGDIHIKTVTFDPGGGAAKVDIGLTDYSFGIGYYWAFAYGNSTDGLHFYLCGDSLKLATSGDVAVSGCILK